jgi:SAM-dependent methyltransferase
MAGERRERPGMKVFAEYAEYYDLLYRDKDYEGECDFLEMIFERYSRRRVRSVLDIGCGTGGHCIPLNRRGYDLVGVDRSEEMVHRGQAKTREMKGRIPFVCGDLRALPLRAVFDAVVILFNVAGYQKEDRDVHDMLETVAIHLKPGGILVFDFWFGPSVLADKPQARLKEILSGDLRVLRFAEPALHAEAKRVDIHYRVLGIRGRTVTADIREKHEVRFFTVPEIKAFLEHHNMEMLHICKWMEIDRPPAAPEWNACVVARSS